MLGIMHSATGAWLSKVAGSRHEAILLGAVSHGVLDFIGHEEPFDEEGNARLAVLVPDIALTVTAIASFGARRGWLSPPVLGSVASILPDAEHFLPGEHGSNKSLFPSHRFGDLLHSRTRPKLSLRTQFLAGALLWLLLALGSELGRKRWRTKDNATGQT